MDIHLKKKINLSEADLKNLFAQKKVSKKQVRKIKAAFKEYQTVQSKLKTRESQFLSKAQKYISGNSFTAYLAQRQKALECTKHELY